MSIEFETAGAASMGGMTTRQKADLSEQPCRNCGEMVSQRYCPNCGQLAASFHRPVLSLIGETIGDTFTLDGRLARTLPVLMFRPGRLTRNYTEGKRARYVPPFRLFLLASLLFYLVLFALVPPGQFINVDDETRAEITASISEGQTAEAAETVQETARERLNRANINVEAPSGVQENIENQIVAVLENQDQFAAQLENWLPRLSILIVPLTIFALTLLHVWRRSLYIYDHAIHALHLHSWIYLTGAFLMLAGPYLPGTVLGMFLLAFFVYVWRSLAVVGTTGFFMSGFRFFLLLIFWQVVITVIIITTVIVSGFSVQA
ncbi:MAG: DUF3667 domain-containing protein [Pseudomonadota bacterium]